MAESTICLMGDREKVIFYTSSHTGVLYDWVNGRQQLLQGHCNQISATAITSDRRWIVTADKGPNSLLIVRDQTPGSAGSGVSSVPGFQGMNALPIKTLFDLHDKTGVVAAEFSSDSKYLFTLGNEAKQTLAIWDWTTESDKPMIHVQVQGQPQKCIRVNPEDPFEVLTNGDMSVNFFTWERDGTISQHIPRLSSKDFKHTPSGFMSSSFIPTTNQSVTTTADGDVVVWTDRSLNNLSVPLERGKKAAVKFMSSISFSSQSWMDTDAIDSVIEGYDIPEFIVATKQAKIILLSNNSTIVGRGDGRVQSPRATVSRERNGEKVHSTSGAPFVQPVVAAQYDKVYGLCAHPSQPHFAVAGHSETRLQDGQIPEGTVTTPSGTSVFSQFNFSGIQASDQQGQSAQEKEKRLQQMRKGQKEQPPDVLKVQTIAYSHDGGLIAAGFANGTVRLLNSLTLADHDGPRNPQGMKLANHWNVSKHAIILASFSTCGSYLAFADAGHAVTLFRKELKVGPKKDIQGQGPAIERLAAGTLSVQWVFIGRCQAHFKPIISLIFIPTATETHTLRLVSVSKDRHVAEYDIAGSTITGGMTLKSLKRIEQSAIPLAATLFTRPPSAHSKPHQDGQEPSSMASDFFVLTANSEFKMKLQNANTQMCRKTVLGPTYGGLLTNLKVVQETEGGAKYLAYATREKVISNIVTSYDGSYLLTAGIEDGTVHMWAMHPNALEAQISIGGKGIEPFLNMLDPSGSGVEGSIYKEMEDYFYYAQLRTQGEDATNARLIQETVELSEVPSIMQAMGFYPSAQEIEDMVNEVKFSRIEEGELVDSISFADLIKLFVNHRPVFEYTESDLLTALVQAIRLEPGRLHENNLPTRLRDTDTVTKAGLLSLLQQYGETMSKTDFDTAFRALLINEPNYNGVLSEKFAAREFIENVLGLQPVSAYPVAAQPVAAAAAAAAGGGGGGVGAALKKGGIFGVSKWQ
ncbi:WD40-repeat-containing domain protein [Chytridium lagenaria]|nr:WD40-repeat-containing domain protein [Chytridium lagenaria]